MANANLSINVGANIGAAVKDMASLSGSLTNIQLAALRAGASSARFGLQASQAFSSVNKSLSTVINPLSQFEKTIQRFGGGVKVFSQDLPRAFDSFAKGVKTIPPAAAAASAALAKIPGSTNSATFALTNLGRVAQDLPFGFIGIQNNLNPLLESFQRLRAETGSNRAAFSALGKSLIGAGGIGLALSIVSGAALIFSNGIQGFGKKSKEAAEEQDKLKLSVEGAATAIKQANAETLNEIGKVRALSTEVLNQSNSYGVRKRALDELGKINKAYFGDLTLEKGIYEKLTSAVNQYSTALLNVNIQKQLGDKVTEAIFNEKDLEKQFDDLTAKINKRREKIAAAIQFKISRGLIDDKPEVRKAELDFLATEDKILLDLIPKRREIADQWGKASDLLGNLKQDYEAAGKAVLRFKSTQETKTGSGKEDTELDLINKRIAAINELEKTFGRVSQELRKERVDLQIRLLIKTGEKEGFKPDEIQRQIKALTESLEIQPAQVTIPIEPIIPEVDISSKIAKAFGLDKGIPIPKEIADTGKSLGKLLADSVVNGITDASNVIGEALGGLLSGEGIGNALARAGEGILKIIGTIIQQLGTQIIVTSKAVLLLKAALNGLFGPGGATIGIAVGIGLVALGGLLKSIKFSVPQFAEGGIATSATLGIFGERGPEAIIPLSQLNRFGGGGNITLLPSIRYEGSGFRIMLQRANKSFNQFG